MGKSVVTFDVGASSLKMAVFSLERNRIQLTDFDVSPVSIPAGTSLEETNHILARQMKASLSLRKIKARSILASISGQSVFTRFVKLPAVEEEKVSQIIRYEAQQQVPFPIEDVEWDHHIIGKSPTGEIDIVLVAVKNDMLSSFIHECRKAGLEVGLVDVAPLSVYNCLRYSEQEFTECTAVIDFGARAANLIIGEGDELWARTIPIGGDDITAGIAKELNVDEGEAERLKHSAWVPGSSTPEPEDATEQQRKAARVVGSFISRMMAELSRSIGFYRSQAGHSAVKRILLCGGGCRLRNFREFLSGRFKVDVGSLLPLRRVAVAPRIDRAQLNQVSDLLSGVVGLGLRGAETARIRINLLPKAIARQKELSKKKVLLTAAGWMLVVALLLMAFQKKMVHGDNSRAFGRFVSSLGKTVGPIMPSGPTLKEELENLNTILSKDSAVARQISGVKGEIQAVERKVDAIGQIQDARLDWAEFIEDLKNVKIKVAGTGQMNYIWLTSLRITTSPGVIQEYLPEFADDPRAIFASRSSVGGVSSSRKTGVSRTGTVDKRPWVFISGYVKIPPELRGDESAAAARVREFMRALKVMGQTFGCQKDHRFREDENTGDLYPVSPDTGPATAYRYRWDEEKKEVVLEGFTDRQPPEGEEASASEEAWQTLATLASRKKPDWLGDGRIAQGDDIDIPCPIGLAETGGRGRVWKCERNAGYLDDVNVRYLKLLSEKIAMFTIVARFAGDFDYPEKSGML
jgi:type IV pilus assembly protein PilM